MAIRPAFFDNLRSKPFAARTFVGAHVDAHVGAGL
jgi:hypothetical protein